MCIQNNSVCSRVLLFSFVTTVALCHPSWAETVTVEATKDTSIFSENNNSNGQGDLFSGRTRGRQEARNRRTLIQFDLTDRTPFLVPIFK